MLNKTLAALFITSSLFAATAAQADHNSIWGPGTANMPNDIHNSAIEDDQEVFLDLVQQGGGADSVNRYTDTDTTTVTSTTDRSNRPDVSDRRSVDRSATDVRAASRSMARTSTTAVRSGGGSRR